MEEHHDLNNQHQKTLTIIVVTGAHLLILLAFFFVLMQEIHDSKHMQDFARILSQSPHEEAQVLFLNEPGNSTQEQNDQLQSPGTAIQALSQAMAMQEQENIITQETEPTDQPHEIVEETKIGDIPFRPDAIQQEPQPPQISKRKKRNYPGIPGNITLGDITRGFIKSMHQEKGAHPGTSIDSNQLARQRYGTRVWTLLRHSYQATRMPTHLFGDITTDALLLLTIKKDGTLLNIALQHPNKTHDLREIESILIKAAKTAGLFPPIPRQFETDTITLTFPLGIRGKEGVHMYDFVYN